MAFKPVTGSAIRSLASVAVLAAVAVATPAAQAQRVPGLSNGFGPPMDLRPLGVALGVRAPDPAIFRTPPKKLCGIHIGCIVIVNMAINWDIIGFSFDVSKPGQAPRWFNQFTEKLRPKSATILIRVGDKSMTDIPLKVTFRSRATGEKIEQLASVNLFDDPDHTNIMLKANVVLPQVIVEPSPDNH
ncbi:MAG: hypothetical protein JWR80_6152 [Bradyrhizobium sp.]|nr:hypothetical protein [Bradyrhizobium sp.]